MWEQQVDTTAADHVLWGWQKSVDISKESLDSARGWELGLFGPFTVLPTGLRSRLEPSACLVEHILEVQLQVLKQARWQREAGQG